MSFGPPTDVALDDLPEVQLRSDFTYDIVAQKHRAMSAGEGQ
jgi:hypothetical protein